MGQGGGAKLLRTARLRADTTVVPANVAYPTDSGLLAKAVRRIAVRAARRIQAAGGATRTRMRDRRRAAARRAHADRREAAQPRKQGREESTPGLRRMTGELAGLAAQPAGTAAAGQPAGRCATRRRAGCGHGRGSGRVRGAAAGRAAPAAVTDRAADVTTIVPRRPGSGWPGTRRTARPGWSACMTPTPGRSPRAVGKPVEFGYKAQVTDNDDGIILDYTVEHGAPADGPQLAPAIERVTQPDRPRAPRRHR